MSLDSCCDILNSLGMRADGVNSVQLAVDHAVKRHQEGKDYFACILDWKMPSMDGIETARAIRKCIGTTGMAIEWVADGKAAVDAVLENGDNFYDIVFMDVQMPVMNGYDATRAIRSHSSSYCKTVPIVAMTANAFAEDVQAAKTVGMNEHIAKPVNMQALRKTLHKWLG